jgi:hypothetical protein
LPAAQKNGAAHQGCRRIVFEKQKRFFKNRLPRSRFSVIDFDWSPLFPFRPMWPQKGKIPVFFEYPDSFVSESLPVFAVF